MKNSLSKNNIKCRFVWKKNNNNKYNSDMYNYFKSAKVYILYLSLTTLTLFKRILLN